MKTKFKSYRTRILFVGLTKEEMIKVETAFSRYSTFYRLDLKGLGNISPYDLICIDSEVYLQNQSLLLDTGIVTITISDAKNNSQHALERPIFVKEWLDTVSAIIAPTIEPELNPLVVGAVVRSKTTPLFGKGIVTSILSEEEVMVSFPKSNYPKINRPIRCHKSQLQILGNISNMLSETSKSKLKSNSEKRKV